MLVAQLNADDFDRLAMLLAIVVLFLYAAGVRVRFDRLRFSLRTLLIAMTLISATLGIVVALTR